MKLDIWLKTRDFRQNTAKFALFAHRLVMGRGWKKSGSGMLGIGKVGFMWELKFWVFSGKDSKLYLISQSVMGMV